MTADFKPSLGALAGLKVVELGQLIAGPFAAKTLADFGADVIKIEPPGSGDPLRQWRLIKDGTSVWWQVQSRNKRSLALDLRQTESQAIVRKLVAESDILIENFRRLMNLELYLPFFFFGKGAKYDQRIVPSSAVLMRKNGEKLPFRKLS